MVHWEATAHMATHPATLQISSSPFSIYQYNIIYLYKIIITVHPYFDLIIRHDLISCICVHIYILTVSISKIICKYTSLNKFFIN